MQSTDAQATLSAALLVHCLHLIDSKTKVVLTLQNTTKEKIKVKIKIKKLKISQNQNKVHFVEKEKTAQLQRFDCQRNEKYERWKSQETNP